MIKRGRRYTPVTRLPNVCASRSCYSPDRDHTVQGVRRQVQRRPLRRDHVRRLQGSLQTVAVVRGQLPVSAQQELRGGPRQPEPVPVLPAPEVPPAGNVPRR